MWTSTFDGMFFITLAGLLLAGFKFAVEYCLKSKCSEFQLCCIKIHRDVRVEAEIEQAAMRAGGARPTEESSSVPDLASLRAQLQRPSPIRLKRSASK